MIGDLTTLQNVKGWITLADRPVVAISQANPAVVSCLNHNFTTGNQIEINGALGMTEVNGIPLTVTVIDVNNFSIGLNSTGYPAYQGGGLAGPSDVLLARLIAEVSGWIGLETWRDFAEQTYTEVYNGKGSNRLMLKNRPITGVTALVVDGMTILPSAGFGQTGYTFDDDFIYLFGYCFSRGMQNVQVSYTAGLLTGDPVLMLAEQVCIRLVALAYNEKDRTGMKSQVLAGQTTSFNVDDLPADVKRMIHRLRRVAPVGA